MKILLPQREFIFGLATISKNKKNFTKYVQRYIGIKLTAPEEAYFSQFFRKIKLITEKKYIDFYNYFVKNVISESFAKAIRIYSDDFLKKAVNAALLLKLTPREIGLPIDDAVLSKYLFYFMNTQGFDLLDWREYLLRLKEDEFALYEAALAQEKERVMYILGKHSALSKSRVLEDITSSSYYKYKELLRYTNTLFEKMKEHAGDEYMVKNISEQYKDLTKIALHYAELAIKSAQSSEPTAPQTIDEVIELLSKKYKDLELEPTEKGVITDGTQRTH